jgi:hypothetical protein
MLVVVSAVLKPEGPVCRSAAGATHLANEEQLLGGVIP